MENSEKLDNSIVFCPSCNISLAKGDGCNSVVCVCGHQFSWSAEHEKLVRCLRFKEKYPEETSKKCAHVLCTIERQERDNGFSDARAWYSRNQQEVNANLYNWFCQQYRPCPSQFCATMSKSDLPEGARTAMSLYSARHQTEVKHCMQQLEYSKEALFHTMYTDAKEKAGAALRLMRSNRFSVSTAEGHIYPEANSPERKLLDEHLRMVNSAAIWVSKNKKLYADVQHKSTIKAVTQFLILYGHRKANTIQPSKSFLCPYARTWNRDTSNKELKYTNNDSTVERVGSASCYPATFASLPGCRCGIIVRIDHAPVSSNWLTFGICQTGKLASSSSDGVGRSNYSWGLTDDRSSSNSNCSIVSCGKDKGTCRKLIEGDILSCYIDCEEGWCRVALNDPEFSYTFKVPPATPEEYSFAMSFANDHRVTICEPMSGLSPFGSQGKTGKIKNSHKEGKAGSRNPKALLDLLPNTLSQLVILKEISASVLIGTQV
jgi:hypothetical protein